MEIRYEKLTHENFGGHSLDDFIRHQEIHECWRNVDGGLKLVPNNFTEDWSVEKCREVATGISCKLEKDLSAFAAFCGKRVVGFVTIEHEIFGKSAKYVNLEQFQVSEDFRAQGIGRKLFTLACSEAKKIGAQKLYISAHSSKESHAAYKALGCVPVSEVNEKMAAEEPFDIQMEFELE
ncbi:GNAT family N-acetyltransferase [uncultured Treponema sp.]|uniref:GNAT family N-acetyltransferase n=1 Tax=uncultured Treponema sp. TaxID=162155 RepID=UPI00280BEADE|nr:GNAT family N-acetyltransferase [uncultured Treponema sp.]